MPRRVRTRCRDLPCVPTLTGATTSATTTLAADANSDRAVEHQRCARRAGYRQSTVTTTPTDALGNEARRSIAGGLNGPVETGRLQFALGIEGADLHGAAFTAGTAFATNRYRHRARHRTARNSDGCGISTIAPAATDTLKKDTC